MAVTFKSNLGMVIKATDEQLARAAEIIGGMAESYAKLLCPVDTGRLRSSITHAVEDNGHTVAIGSNVTYSSFVELGTRRMHARPYLRPAIENHREEYKVVLETELQR